MVGQTVSSASSDQSHLDFAQVQTRALLASGRKARLIQVRPGWWEYWQSFHFTHALLPNDYSLVPALERAGWRRIYRDQTATLLAPGGSR